jgi:hypothetical protein
MQSFLGARILSAAQKGKKKLLVMGFRRHGREQQDGSPPPGPSPFGVPLASRPALTGASHGGHYLGHGRYSSQIMGLTVGFWIRSGKKLDIRQ